MNRTKPYSIIENHPKRTEIVNLLMKMLRQKDYGVQQDEERITLNSISSTYRINARKLSAYVQGPLQTTLAAIRDGAAASHLQYDVLGMLKRGIKEVYRCLDELDEIPSVSAAAGDPVKAAGIARSERIEAIELRQRVLNDTLRPLLIDAKELVGSVNDRSDGQYIAPVPVTQTFYVAGGRGGADQVQGGPEPVEMPALPEPVAEAAAIEA